MTKILIAEDNDMTSKAIKSILEKRGYLSMEAQNGKEALELLEKDEFDILITDLMLPYINGLELIHKLKTDVSKRSLKIIVVTGIHNELTIAEAFKLGADDYLIKPIDPVELINRVRKLEGPRIRKPGKV